MSETIKITKDCYLEKHSGEGYTISSPDGGGAYCKNDIEFGALALHSPLVQRMRDKLKELSRELEKLLKEDYFLDEEDSDFDIIKETNQLLSDIAAMERGNGTPSVNIADIDSRDVPIVSGHEIDLLMKNSNEKCHADRDGECDWSGCPQKRDGEPEKSGRKCPLDWWYDHLDECD